MQSAFEDYMFLKELKPRTRMTYKNGQLDKIRVVYVEEYFHRRIGDHPELVVARNDERNARYSEDEIEYATDKEFERYMEYFNILQSLPK